MNLNKAAAALGKKGGKSGTGKAKARTSKQAQAAAKSRWRCCFTCSYWVGKRRSSKAYCHKWNLSGKDATHGSHVCAAWEKRKTARLCVCGKPVEQTTHDGIGLCAECYQEVPKFRCADLAKQQVCDVCQGVGGVDVLQ
jgi:hypothetical protein